MQVLLKVKASDNRLIKTVIEHGKPVSANIEDAINTAHVENLVKLVVNNGVSGFKEWNRQKLEAIETSTARTLNTLIPPGHNAQWRVIASSDREITIRAGIF
jgi:hypothetical protein